MSADSPDVMRRSYVVAGRVQGVGFRPFVYRLAAEHGLTGSVLNSSQGVAVEIQGPFEAVRAFGRELKESPPPLAEIVSCEEQDLEPVPGEAEFIIIKSRSGQGHNVLISPDTALCADCRAEMLDPRDRRYLYPFTNCTNCGPRYTITRAIPYDRPFTSMACFPMCRECQAEYDDPLDRRFHAQPNACPVCGPVVWFTDKQGQEKARGREAMQRTAEALDRGEIAAVKGLGGFHLACDARNHDAVMELRARKNRWDKPLAVMVPDLDAARGLAHVSDTEAKQLDSLEKPIVLCRAKLPFAVSPAVSPDTVFIGLMLPYTPLHLALFHELALTPAMGHHPALVMTSGNTSSEPICLGNREALKRLGHIADRFLLHNRDILIRTDDSVLRVNPLTGKPQFFRRARGFTPKPVFLEPLKGEDAPSVLGVGPELKNTLCLTKGDQAFVGQHIGDMENLETLGFYREIAAHLEMILETAPRAVAHDLHPDYMATRFAQERADKDSLPLVPVQHHVAHILAALAENRHNGPALGWALDGTGLGEDGTLWGGELLLVDPSGPSWQRLAHFSPMHLPGGETAIREPWRIAQACLYQLGVVEPGEKPWPWLASHGQASAMLPQLLEKQLNCPQSTSCGRLFDAVSAMLGLCSAITYEGQAAILLENQLYAQGQWPPPDPALETGYECGLITGPETAVLDTLSLFRQVLADWERDESLADISRRFHLGLAHGLAGAARHFSRETGISHVALSGGSMQNLTLSVALPQLLEVQGLTPLTHREVPPNDGCISLGQAVWARLLNQKS
ncbi:MAG: carbamoyltransferase HypF [Desulfovibrio sp.]|nr:MAG: carbamoyltransferase HypF [Desulfovibrio sp.]